MTTSAPRWGKSAATAAAVQHAAAAGFDYVAINMEYIMSGGQAQFATQKNTFQECQLMPEICLSVLPAGVAVTTPGFNLYYWLDYIKQALHRLAELHCRALLWRDGAARTLPLEGDETAAKAQCLQFVYMLCRQCEEYKMEVMVEPLPAAVTNYLNTLAEVQEFIAHIGKDNLHPALNWADDAALGEEMTAAENVSRIRHISAAVLPTVAVPVLQTAGGDCSITLLGEADKEALRRARQLLTEPSC